MIEVSGKLEKDALWRGDVLLTGDVLVPAGVTLRVIMGSRITATAHPRWSCAVFRSAPEGWPIEASERERCDLIVQGRLEMDGVIVTGGPWGGLTMLGKGRARLSGVMIEAEAPFGVQAFDDSVVELADCGLASCGIGLWGFGLSSIRFRRGVVSAARHAALACEGARVVLEDAAVTGGQRALCAEGWASIAARRCAFSGQAEGVSLAKDEAHVAA